MVRRSLALIAVCLAASCAPVTTQSRGNESILRMSRTHAWGAALTLQGIVTGISGVTCWGYYGATAANEAFDANAGLFAGCVLSSVFSAVFVVVGNELLNEGDRELLSQPVIDRSVR